MKNRQPAIDIAKLIASFLVVAIHTQPFLQINEILNFVFVDIIARIAVPFFVVSTGFFVGKRVCYVDDKISELKKSRTAVLKSACKILRMYIIWSVLYLIVLIPNWIETDWFSFIAFVDWGIVFFTKGSYYHLWYLASMCYALFLLAIILPILKKRIIYILSIVLWFVEAINHGYRMLLPSVLQDFFAFFDTISAPFQSIIRMLPLLLLGIIIQKQTGNNLKRNCIRFILSSLLLCLEVYVLKSFGGESFSYIFSTLPAVYFLFKIVHSFDSKIKLKNSILLADISTTIYCVHPVVIIFVKNVLTVEANILIYILTILFSTMVGLFLYCVKNKLLKYQ